MRIDAKNGYNTISRSAIEATIRERAPHLWPIFMAAHQRPIKLVYSTEDGPRDLEATSGTLQGLGLATQYFCYGEQPAIEATLGRMKLVDPEIAVSYISDDGIWNVDCDAVPELLRVAREELARVGLSYEDLSVEVLHHDDAIGWEVEMPIDVKCRNADRGKGITILGTPIGSDDYIQNELDKFLAKQQDLIRKIKMMDDAQTERLIIRYCVNPQAGYLLRTLMPEHTADFAVRVDQQINDYTRWSLAAPALSRKATLLNLLPARFGGGGLLSAEMVRPAAFAASATALFQAHARYKILPQSIRHVMLDGQLREAYREANALIRDEFLQSLDFETPSSVIVAPKKLQHALTEKESKRRFEAITAGINVQGCRFSSVQQARVVSNAGPHAYDWLQAIPSERPLRMTSEEFAQRLHARLLGRPRGASEETRCPGNHGGQLTMTHAEGCVVGGGATWRHNLFMSEVAHMLRQEGYVVEIEPKGAFSNPDAGNKHGDILVPHGPGDRTYLLDVSFASLSGPYRGPSNVGQYAKTREAAKDRTYYEFCKEDTMLFEPFVLETPGTWGRRAMDFMHRLFKESKRPFSPINFTARTPKQYWFQRLSVCAQRLTARKVDGMVADALYNQ